jgi:predicted enzyme related to lactoylglutathione lyase
MDAALKKVQQLGAKTVTGRQAVGDMGFSAYFEDTEGNVIGLWQNANRVR